MERLECSCDYFEEGFQPCSDNRSYNHKDEQGWLLGYQFTTVILAGLFSFGVDCYMAIYGITTTPLIMTITLTTLALIGGYDFYREVSNDPMNIVYMVSCLIEDETRTPPILNVDQYFPQHREFEKAYDRIKQEVLAACQDTNKIPLTVDTFGTYNRTIGSDVRVENGEKVGWRLLMISAGDKFSPDGLTRFPTLVKLLKKHSNLIKSCAVSILPPQTMIPRHVGYYKGVMRYMLPIEVPDDYENVYLCNNRDKLLWTVGKSVLFDDTFPHKVCNLTNQRRIVLYMDVVRPLEDAILNRLNQFIINEIANSSITRDEIARTEYLIDL